MICSVRTTVMLGFACVAMLACTSSDAPTMPEMTARFDRKPTASSDPTAPGVADTLLVLKRLTPLPADITLSAVIGPAGGEIKINESGGKIDFPAGALSAPTLITMTAKAGYDVAYEFQPHGITFAVPVKIQQDLRNTWADQYPQLLKLIGGGYYENDLAQDYVDQYHYFAHVQETRIGVLDRNTRQAKIYINHFSGYLFSSGARSDFE